MTNGNFYPFPVTSKTEWVAQIEKDLRGKDFEQNLVSRLWNELRVHPFYTKEDKSITGSDTNFHPEPEIPGTPPRVWANAVSIFPEDPQTANQEIIHVLENGVDSLMIHLKETENPEKILSGVYAEFIEINWITPQTDTTKSLSLVKSWADTLSTKKSQLRGSILWSPFTALFTKPGNFENELRLSSTLIEEWKSYPNFRPITIDFSRYSNSGGNGLQELTYGLGEIIELIDALTERGIDPELIFRNLAFHASAGNIHFAEIAKLKALRLLVAELASFYGVTLLPESIHLTVSTSQWSKTLMDKNTNLIRQTYEAMAAVLGGCNTLWVRPVEGKEASTLEKRILRNVSPILKEEAYLDKVVNPASGSYYLDSLQSEIMNAVREKLKALESRGGWMKDFSSRLLHQEIRKNRETEQKMILENSEFKVGINKYPAIGKLVNNLAFVPFEEKEYELNPAKASYLAERQTLTTS